MRSTHETYHIFSYYGLFGRPILVIRNLELMRKILIKDFDHFTDRNMNQDNISPEANKHFSNAMTVLRGDKWRSAREMVSPTFTSGQIKASMVHIQDSAQELVNYLNKIDLKNVEVKALLNLYTAETLGRVGCGILPQVFTQPENNEFYRQVTIMLGGGKPNLMTMVRFLSFGIPKVAKWFKIALIDPSAMNFVDNIIRTSMRTRGPGDKQRHDFIEMMVESIKSFEKGKKGQSFTKAEIEDIVISNAILLFFAGNDTTAAAITTVLYFMAMNPDAQDKLYEEINETILDNDGSLELSHDQLFAMKFMGKVIKESLRFWSFNFMDRVCVKDYYLDKYSLVIPKGMIVQNSIDAIYQDPVFFANPEAFDPEGHFEDDNLFSPTFFAFGQGPRSCLGMRFALTMFRIALVHILYHYKIVPNEDTTKDFSKRNPLDSSILPHGGIKATFIKRKD